MLYDELFVKSGLIPSRALEAARAAAASKGGTIGEALVYVGAIDDEALTMLYCERFAIPRAASDSLTRIDANVIAMIRGEQAIRLRAIPIALDLSTLTVAVSDPTDPAVLDELASATRTYVVQTAATQQQIAWCLGHYYGHVTALEQRRRAETASQTSLEPPGAAGRRRRTSADTAPLSVHERVPDLPSAPVRKRPARADPPELAMKTGEITQSRMRDSMVEYPIETVSILVDKSVLLDDEKTDKALLADLHERNKNT
jgi:hypothetical protein